MKQVGFNRSIKVRFENGGELVVTIFQKRPELSLPGFQMSKEAPLAKAILNKKIGEVVTYFVQDQKVSVTIVSFW